MITAERDVETRKRDLLLWHAQVALRVLTLRAGGLSLKGSPMEDLARDTARWAHDELIKDCPRCGGEIISAVTETLQRSA